MYHNRENDKMPRKPFILVDFIEGFRALVLQVCVLVNENVAGHLANRRSVSKEGQ